MQQNVFPAAEKILFDVEYILNKNLNIISFDILPIEEYKNKSPVFHRENSLGLASWCIQPLYCYVYNCLLNMKRNQHRREEPTIISRWLLGALLLNPDVMTFWNMRRELTRNGRINAQDEFRLVNIVLYHKAKCFEAFSYRRWLLKFLLISYDSKKQDLEILLHNEMKTLSIAANSYRNNCHVWSHREYVIPLVLETLLKSKFNSFLDDEWEISTKWCNCHVSDYSGFSYRQFLLKRLLSRTQSKFSQQFLLRCREIVFDFVKVATRSSNDVFLLHDGSNQEILDLLHGVDTANCPQIRFEQTLINLSYWIQDCNDNENLINTFPSHEALWYHRRFLLYSLRTLNHWYQNYSIYKTRNFNLFQDFESCNKEKTTSMAAITTDIIPENLLEMAFNLRSKDLIDSAKRYGSYENNLAEKFSNFLICMKLYI